MDETDITYLQLKYHEMNFDQFKEICVMKGFDSKLVEAIKPYMKEKIDDISHNEWKTLHKFGWDFYFDTYEDINTIEQGFQAIYDEIESLINHRDRLGRTQLIIDADESLKISFLKTYWLLGGQPI